MDKTSETNLLLEVDRFLSKTGMAESYFGKVSSGNSELVKRLRDGRRVWPETADKVRAFMARGERHVPVKRDAKEAAE